MLPVDVRTHGMNGLEQLCLEIERAINAELFQVALTTALTLPDVCYSTASFDGDTRGRFYRTWYEDNLAQSYPEVSASDLWALRNSVLHNGRLRHRDLRYDRIIFTFPHPRRPAGGLHRQVLPGIGGTRGALVLAIEVFCTDIVNAVRQWHLKNMATFWFYGNNQRVVKYRQSGSPPYCTGFPVIA